MIKLRRTLPSLLCVLLCTLVSVTKGQVMGGKYLIGSSIGTDFKTIAEALDSLHNKTISADIVFDIEAGVYEEILRIDSIRNDSFLVTFQGLEQEGVIVRPNGKYKKAGMYIDRVSNLVFRNFTFQMDSMASEKFVIGLDSANGIFLNRTSNVTFDNLVIRNDGYEDFNPARNAEQIANSIYLDSTANTTVRNCHFSGAGFHIRYQGFDQLEIEDNYFENQHFCISNYGAKDWPGNGIYVRRNVCAGPWTYYRTGIEVRGYASHPWVEHYLTNIVIEDNLVDCRQSFSGQYGIVVENATRVTITGNVVKNGFYGLALYADSSASIRSNYLNSVGNVSRMLYIDGLSRAEITNNFCFSEKGCMYMDSNDSLIFRFNTLKSGPYQINVFDSKGPSVIENNIFDTDTAAPKILYISGTDSNELRLDYNAYSIMGDKTLYVNNYTHNGVDYNTGDISLSTWQALQSDFDQHSRELNHIYRSSVDMHIGNGTDYRFGDPGSMVFEDYDGNSRDSVTGFDVGCDQFTEDIALFDFSAAEGFSEYCQMLGDSHEVCFRSDFIDSPKSTFVMHSTEDDVPSDFEVFNLTHSLDSGHISVSFDVYNHYKWHKVEETFYLPNGGDSDSSNLILTRRDTTNEYQEIPFHFVVRKLFETGIGEQLYSINQPKLYRNGENYYVFSDVMREVILYSLDGRRISSEQQVQNLNLNRLPVGMYIVRASDGNQRSFSWRLVAY